MCGFNPRPDAADSEEAGVAATVALSQSLALELPFITGTELENETAVADFLEMNRKNFLLPVTPGKFESPNKP